jgi:putative ABC transport system ATP-binding protein
MNKIKKAAPIVCLAKVTKTFNDSVHPTTAVREVSLEAIPGELVLLLGPSGSGKTTLLTLIAGLSEPSAGTILLYGKNINQFTPDELQRLRAKRIGFIFQTFLLIDSLTVRENVDVVLRFNGCKRADRSTKTQSLLRRLRIEHLADKFPGTLSQGEKQRAAIARAIANDAKLIIADEPTGSLETKQGIEIIRLLHSQAKEENKCVIVASHDLRLREFADRILRMVDGVIMEEKAFSP